MLLLCKFQQPQALPRLTLIAAVSCAQPSVQANCPRFAQPRITRTAQQNPQDFRLSELLAREGRAAVIVLNKWDRVDEEKTPQVRATREKGAYTF